MMRKFLMTTAILLGTAAAPPTTAMAQCDPSDLEGRWALFVYGDNLETADSPFILSCTAILNSNGRFKRGSRCASAELRAALEVNRNCTISGTITLRFNDGPNPSCGVNAAVTQDRQVISGVGACENDDLFMFNMVKG
jgi:hypothetical protein